MSAYKPCPLVGFSRHARGAIFHVTRRGCILDPKLIEYTVPRAIMAQIVVERLAVFVAAAGDSACLCALGVSAVLFSFWLRPHGRVGSSRLSGICSAGSFHACASAPDLFGVIVDVPGVNFEPVFDSVTPAFGMGSFTLPLCLCQPIQKIRRRLAGSLNCFQG
jgi:hypothetical protein